MATTSLWHIEGRLKDLIDYVENSEKTKAKAPELQDLYNVFSYVQRPEATQKGEYVTALNCLRETALRQSFVPGEITPEDANRLGCELAKRFTKGNHAYIVCTHIDKAHIHNVRPDRAMRKAV